MPKDSTLWIVHNAEGLKRIEQFVNFIWRQIPRTLVFDVEVIEAESAVLQKISDSTSGVGGHSRAREMIEKLIKSHQARVVERHRLETLSGGHCQWYSLNELTGTFEVGMHATLADNDRTVQVEMTLIQGKRTGTKLSNSLRLVAGTPRMVALWKPVEEGDGRKDVLRAAFVRADVMPLEQPTKIGRTAQEAAAVPKAK